MALQYTVLARGSGTRNPLVTVSLPVLWDVLSGDMTNIDQYFSQTVANAELGLPEGERVEATITGWNVPAIGNVGQMVADDVNSQWAAGKIIDPYSPTEKIAAWPEFPNQIASYDAQADELVLRWRKGQAWFLWIFVAILAFLGLRSLLQSVGLWNGSYLYSLFGVTPSTPTSPTTTTSMPLWEKLLIGGTALATLGGIAIFAGKLELAKAGAGKSITEINVGESPR